MLVNGVSIESDVGVNNELWFDENTSHNEMIDVNYIKREKLFGTLRRQTNSTYSNSKKAATRKVIYLEIASKGADEIVRLTWGEYRYAAKKQRNLRSRAMTTREVFENLLNHGSKYPRSLIP
ncbi:BgTH12-02836 [Blumeria graminis f. sp. triticale]|uniref:BgTH12-02836 n=1 Tax=Blumeria graminis f. sp. triticale TaxID=1689686 RepID=A0A9W4GFU2_BLUGR|nr:BgTH12-02836 [Blumeria graminis f. sp. triticale]